MARSIKLDVKKFVSDPSTPTVTTQGTSGATGYSYKIVAVAADGATSAASASGSTSSGNSTLSGANFNRVTWPAVPAAASYEVYRTAGGASQGKIGSTTGTTFDDTGLAGDGVSAPTQNGTGIGSEMAVLDLREVTVQFDGTFSGALQLEGRVSASAAFVSVGAAQTAPGLLAVPQKLAEVRVRMTAYSSGEPAVYACGNQRA
jgi:hypothetical protein